MPIRKVKDYLDTNNIKYVIISHSPAFTAREVAASTLVPRREFAKSVIVDAEGGEIMVVVSASRHVDLEAVASALDIAKVRLATEHEFQSRFPDCEPGAMPPFGNLYDMPVYMDEMVRAVDRICFNAGTHQQILRMETDDYVELVKREITRVVTPGTLTDEALLDPRESNYLAAFVPGGKKRAGEVGIAWAELSTGRFHAAVFRTEQLADQLAEVKAMISKLQK